MKWFVATNESSLRDDQFFDLLKVAVRSAEENTALNPFLIYEGESNSRLEWLKKRGVSVLNKKLHIRKNIEECVKSNFKEKREKMLNVRTGAYLRYEIPIAAQKKGIEDKYILYTDCDVLFLDKLMLKKYKPKYISASGSKEGGYTKFNIGGWMHYNSGVMVMNLESMREEYENFEKFVINDGYEKNRPSGGYWQKNLLLSDQVAVNLYFGDEIEELPNEYNWNPSYGVNEKAKIVHFNGPKWTQWKDYINGKLRPKLTEMIENNRKAYEQYVEAARRFVDNETVGP